MNYALEEIIAEASNLAIEMLPLDPIHTVALLKLPLHHRDPSDRILIAQAVTENLFVVSIDEHFDLYPVKRIWNS